MFFFSLFYFFSVFKSDLIFGIDLKTNLFQKWHKRNLKILNKVPLDFLLSVEYFGTTFSLKEKHFDKNRIRHIGLYGLLSV
jgi:hypothetical protein